MLAPQQQQVEIEYKFHQDPNNIFSHVKRKFAYKPLQKQTFIVK